MHTLLHTPARMTRLLHGPRTAGGAKAPRRHRFRTAALATALVSVVGAASAGCVTVHGERAVIPAATRPAAADAVDAFITAYNKADKAYDGSLDRARVSGALGDINQAGLRANRTIHPHGNAKHTDLTLTQRTYFIPKMAGWPKFFAVEGNPDTSGDSWVLVFTRDTPHALWQASYLAVVSPGELPDLATEDGHAVVVDPDDPSLATAPGRLSQAYVDYLQKGGDTFAPGGQTSVWRANRKRSPQGLARQFIDKPRTDGDYAAVGLRTKDGGALVFFTHQYFEKDTAASNTNLDIPPTTKALTTGDVKQSITLNNISNQMALDPAKGHGQVKIISRIEGLTSATGQ